MLYSCTHVAPLGVKRFKARQSIRSKLTYATLAWWDCTPTGDKNNLNFFPYILWPLTATLTKSHDAAHHRCQRSILGISWKDRITNVEIRTRTGQQTMDNILRERRLRWLGHVFRMDHKRIRQQALYWQVPGYKIGPGRPRTNWRGVVSKDLQKMGFTWEEAEVAALDRHGWRRSVAQCVQLDTGWIRVKVKVKVTYF